MRRQARAASLTPMLQIEDVLRDRGSRYAVSGCPVQGRAGVDAFLADLKRARALGLGNRTIAELAHGAPPWAG